MTFLAFYAALKFWLPLVTAFGMVIGAYRTAKKNVSAWADKLLNNHLSHIQVATEKTAALTEAATAKMDEALKQINHDSRATAHALQRVAESQQAILTGIEVLKDR